MVEMVEVSDRSESTAALIERTSFTIRCGGMVVARVEGPHAQAEQEAFHYAAQYASEGPVKIVRRPLRKVK